MKQDPLDHTTLRCRVAVRAASSCLSSVCSSFTLISPRSSPSKCLDYLLAINTHIYIRDLQLYIYIYT